MPLRFWLLTVLAALVSCSGLGGGDCADGVFEDWSLQVCPSGMKCPPNINLSGGQFGGNVLTATLQDGAICKIQLTIDEGSTKTAGTGSLLDPKISGKYTVEDEATCAELSIPKMSWTFACPNMHMTDPQGTAAYGN